MLSWSVETGKPAKEYDKYQGGGTGPYFVALSPGGKTLFSGFEVGFLDIWDVESTEKKGWLFGHFGLVKAMVFSSDGRTVVTSGRDGAVRFWDIGQVTRFQAK